MLSMCLWKGVAGMSLSIEQVQHIHINKLSKSVMSSDRFNLYYVCSIIGRAHSLVLKQHVLLFHYFIRFEPSMHVLYLHSSDALLTFERVTGYSAFEKTYILY